MVDLVLKVTEGVPSLWLFYDWMQHGQDVPLGGFLLFITVAGASLWEAQPRCGFCHLTGSTRGAPGVQMRICDSPENRGNGGLEKANGS